MGSIYAVSYQTTRSLLLATLPCCACCTRPSPASSPSQNALRLQVLGHNADPRSRMFSAIWMAAPAVASIAWTVREAARWACLVRCCALCGGEEGGEHACCALLQGTVSAPA